MRDATSSEQCGMPLPVRTDFGMENVTVWEFMLQRRRNSNAVNTGSSVHNQRIERLNRDVNNPHVASGFYNEFVQLEEYHMLDPLNDTYLFHLHCLYMPVIGRLTEFVAVHNNHALSTAHNYSPMQLFHVNYRLLQLQNLDFSASINIRDIVQHSRLPLTWNLLPLHFPKRLRRGLMLFWHKTVDLQRQ